MFLTALLSAALIGAGSAQTYWPYHTFKSRPDLHPPVLSINKSGAPLEDGFLFFGPGAGQVVDVAPKQTSPLIMTDFGELIWSAPNGIFSANFKVQTIGIEPVLSYWSGIELPGDNVGHFYGSITVLNISYEEIYTVCPPLDLTPPDVPEAQAQKCQVDGHESVISQQGTVLFTAYNVTTTDLTSVNGTAHGSVWDCLFYVYDLKTMKQLYRWSSLAHVPVSATRNPLGAAGVNNTDPFDYFHINSVQAIPSATDSDITEYYLVNARHTWSTYLVRASTGEVVWTVTGDTGGDFGALAPNSNFRWQHDARLVLPPGSKDAATDPVRVRWFNNYNAFQGNGTAPSNGLILTLTPPGKGAGAQNGSNAFVQADADPEHPIYSDAQGSNEALAHGNRLLSYGFTPTAQEFGPSGDVRMTVTFGPPNQIQSYRMFRRRWGGDPLTRPDVVVVGAEGYVSWNGATDVMTYVMYVGQTKESLKMGETVTKKGFETEFAVPKGTKYLLLEAYHLFEALRNSSIVAVGS